MSENKKIYKKVKLQSPFVDFIALYAVGIILFLTILAIFSVVVMNVDTTQTLMQIYVFADAAIVSFVVSLLSCMVFQSKKLLSGMIIAVMTGVSEFLLLISFNNTNMDVRIYIMIPVILIFSFVGCVSGCNIKLKSKSRRAKK